MHERPLTVPNPWAYALRNFCPAHRAVLGIGPFLRAPGRPLEGCRAPPVHPRPVSAQAAWLRCTPCWRPRHAAPDARSLARILNSTFVGACAVCTPPLCFTVTFITGSYNLSYSAESAAAVGYCKQPVGSRKGQPAACAASTNGSPAGSHWHHRPASKSEWQHDRAVAAIKPGEGRSRALEAIRRKPQRIPPRPARQGGAPPRQPPMPAGPHLILWRGTP